MTSKAKLEWSKEAKALFDALKKEFTSVPNLYDVDFSKAFFMEKNASDFALDAVLLQIEVDDKLHPIAFYSRKFSAAEINYEIYDKELLTIVDSFQE